MANTEQSFGAASTTDDVLEGHDLTGTKVFVTGGNSGLGLETARAMAAKGAHVILAARDQDKLDAAITAIKEAQKDAKLETIICDLASLASIKACGQEAASRFEQIDLLINNAGVMACPKMHTADGFEMQFGTNHLGHFALTKHLMPLIERGANKRIVNLSSRGHHLAPTDLDDPNFETTDYDPWVSYGRAKTANVLFSVGLEKRFGAHGIHALAVHPGGIQTNLGRHLTQDDIAALMERMKTNGGAMTFKTIPQGAATQVWAATSATLEGQGALYCEDCHVAARDDDSTAGGVRGYAIDPEIADALWALSEDMTGERFSA